MGPIFDEQSESYTSFPGTGREYSPVALTRGVFYFDYEGRELLKRGWYCELSTNTSDAEDGYLKIQIK